MTRSTTASPSTRTVDRTSGRSARASLVRLPSGGYEARSYDRDGRPTVLRSASVADLMVRTAEARGRDCPPPAAPSPGAPSPAHGALVVVRADRAPTAGQAADRLGRQLEEAVVGTPFGREVLEDAAAPLRWPDAFGATRVPVAGSDDALLWSPPDAPHVLVLAGTCPGSAGWAGTVALVAAVRRPRLVAVAGLDALGRRPADVQDALRGVPELLVAGRAVDPGTLGLELALLLSARDACGSRRAHRARVGVLGHRVRRDDARDHRERRPAGSRT